MNELLCVVDIQKTFLSENEELENIKNIITETDIITVSSMFKNTEDSMYVSQLNWEECMNPKQPDWVTENTDKTFIKTGYDLTQNKSFRDFLSKKNIDICYLCGCETDACILGTAYGLFSYTRPIIISDACYSFDSEKISNSSFDMLSRNVGDQNIITTEEFKNRKS